MSDLNGALNSMYSHLSAFTPANIQENLKTLQKDNQMLKGMMEHGLDQQGVDLANKIQTQVRTLSQEAQVPTKGAQQMMVSKWEDELKKTRKRIKEILEKPPKPSRSIEKNYKPKAD